MPKDIPQVDHKAGALKCLDWLGSPTEDASDPRTPAVLSAALVHSNLAIAEGQERVAEALENRPDIARESLGGALKEIAQVAIDVDEKDDEARKRIFRIAGGALKGPGS